MDANIRLLEVLRQVAAGAVAPEAAAGAVERLAAEPLGYATLDHLRAGRCGFPEIVYGEGKTAEHLAGIVRAHREGGRPALATRVDAAKAEAVARLVPEVEYDALGRCLRWRPARVAPSRGPVGVVTAGTSDLGVAREVAITLDFLGIAVRELHDVGVAGLHRLLARLDELRACPVLIVVAGMEGALPSVVGGLVAVPVVAVPASVGYGAGAGGWAALLGMLSSCASGVTVVNIDNGVGAACAAARILHGREHAAAPPTSCP